MHVHGVKGSFTRLFFAAGLSLLAGGCQRHENQEPIGTKDDRPAAQGVRPGPDQGQSAVKGAQAEAIGTAVDNLATARCDRELRCNNVGTGRRYDTKDACMSSLRSNQQQDLNLSACPGGVDQKELQECLEEIRKDDCNNPLDNLTRLAACRKTDMCRG